ncbi:MAG: hypothetical protein NVS9B13_07530 [Candidatus Acidiferrum sp.]
MPLTTDRTITAAYRVEVSGWDLNETFFVENSAVCWDESAGKQVALNHMVDAGSMLFVRLLLPATAERTYPVAYVTEYLGKVGGRQYQFRLRQMCTRGGINTK